MTSEEVEKIVKNLPDDMQGILLKGLYDAVDTMCNIADYMRENYVLISVIEDIKSEINELSELDHIEPTYEDCKRDVLEIIEKHTGGEENGIN